MNVLKTWSSGFFTKAVWCGRSSPGLSREPWDWSLQDSPASFSFCGELGISELALLVVGWGFMCFNLSCQPLTCILLGPRKSCFFSLEWSLFYGFFLGLWADSSLGKSGKPSLEPKPRNSPMCISKTLEKKWMMRVWRSCSASLVRQVLCPVCPLSQSTRPGWNSSVFT